MIIELALGTFSKEPEVEELTCLTDDQLRYEK
jgi:hypothetical protein